MSKPVLYVGSGRSALKLKEFKTSEMTVCSVNNAWRLFTKENPCDVWIHSGDFPRERKPLERCFELEVGNQEYEVTSEKTARFVGYEGKFPLHHLGYTIFFQGLFWILWTLRPSVIYTLGFDHDYNPEKVGKWITGGCPGPQNQYGGKTEASISDWAAQFFGQSAPDAFYGHGTPDPMRLGQGELEQFFQRSMLYAETFGCKLYNASGVLDGINSYPQRLPS